MISVLKLPPMVGRDARKRELLGEIADRDADESD